MLRERRKRLTRRPEAAANRLAAIQASVAALGDEDLLDLADIFRDHAGTPLREMAFSEMAYRRISL